MSSGRLFPPKSKATRRFVPFTSYPMFPCIGKPQSPMSILAVASLNQLFSIVLAFPGISAARGPIRWLWIDTNLRTHGTVCAGHGDVVLICIRYIRIAEFSRWEIPLTVAQPVSAEFIKDISRRDIYSGPYNENLDVGHDDVPQLRSTSMSHFSLSAGISRLSRHSPFIRSVYSLRSSTISEF